MDLRDRQGDEGVDLAQEESRHGHAQATQSDTEVQPLGFRETEISDPSTCLAR